MFKNILLIIFGSISLISTLNFFEIHKIGPINIEISPKQCRDSKRYDTTHTIGGGLAISDAYAYILSDAFKKKYVTGPSTGPIPSVHVEKSYFSKRAVDHLFAMHPKANAIGCTYALENDSLKIIINAYRIARTDIEIPPGLDNTYFISKTICPPTCPRAQ